MGKEASRFVCFVGGAAWLPQQLQASGEIVIAYDIPGKGLHPLQEDGVGLLLFSGHESVVPGLYLEPCRLGHSSAEFIGLLFSCGRRSIIQIGMGSPKSGICQREVWIQLGGTPVIWKSHTGVSA